MQRQTVRLGRRRDASRDPTTCGLHRRWLVQDSIGWHRSQWDRWVGQSQVSPPPVVGMSPASGSHARGVHSLSPPGTPLSTHCGLPPGGARRHAARRALLSRRPARRSVSARRLASARRPRPLVRFRFACPARVVASSHRRTVASGRAEPLGTLWTLGTSLEVTRQDYTRRFDAFCRRYYYY